MKQLILLGLAVAVILGAWFVSSRSPLPPGVPAPLVLAKDPSDQMALVRCAQQLQGASPGRFDANSVADLIRLLADSLDDAHWNAVSYAVFVAWDHHRSVVAIRPRLLEIDDVLLPRFARNGSLAEVQGMIRAAGSLGFDSAKINRTLQAAVESPIPSGSFSGSRQELIVAAALSVEDYSRAQEYLGRLQWEDGATPEHRPSAQRLTRMADLCVRFKSSRPDPADLIRTWQILGDDALSLAALRPVLEGFMVGWVLDHSSKVASPKIGEWFEKSAAESGAEALWERVFVKLDQRMLSAGNAVVLDASGLARAFQERYSRKGFEYAFWMRVAERQSNATPDDPTRTTAFYDRARIAAVTDEQRVRAFQSSAAGYLKMLDFEGVRKSADETAAAVQDPALKKELEPILADIAKREAADRDQVSRQEKSIEMDRRKGRLDRMKELLARSRKEEKPPGQVRAIEQALRDLEKESP